MLGRREVAGRPDDGVLVPADERETGRLSRLFTEAVDDEGRGEE